MQAAALHDGFPGAPIIGGVAYVATTISRPGVITRTGPLERLVFGELDATGSPQAEAFLAACLAGGVDAERSDDIRGEIWRSSSSSWGSRP